MTDYLAKAAELIQRASDHSEARHRSGTWLSINADRLEHARAFAMLAAIDKGVLPEAIAEQVYGQFGGQA